MLQYIYQLSCSPLLLEGADHYPDLLSTSLAHTVYQKTAVPDQVFILPAARIWSCPVSAFHLPEQLLHFHPDRIQPLYLR